MAYMPDTPAEFDRLADLVVEKVNPVFRNSVLEGLVEDCEGLAKFLKVSPRTIERKTRDGTIPSFLVGDLRRYHVPEVLEHLKGVSARNGANGLN